MSLGENQYHLQYFTSSEHENIKCSVKSFMFLDQELLVVATIFRVLRPNEIVQFLHNNFHLLPYIIETKCYNLKILSFVTPEIKCNLFSFSYYQKSMCYVRYSYLLRMRCKGDFLSP
jgi:hypothetical protein